MGKKRRARKLRGKYIFHSPTSSYLARQIDSPSPAIHVHKQNFPPRIRFSRRQRRHICSLPYVNLIRRKANIKDNTRLPIGGADLGVSQIKEIPVRLSMAFYNRGQDAHEVGQATLCATAISCMRIKERVLRI